ncbi:DUF1579 family protein [Fimbriimonas ginsengisoli]|uniref:DUF1579 domain-containing protein n=1 Tax=Fimbriimonas ginsengisoli Gsoil 348 TaxID=661478 RepID=A0A068NTT7_FIMGI|nr:DUF1579 family protein [Fimbriimonas ginsengisoli]AIE86777.1 hypothetical protein OP10G_3409 [Fimbriimonas ginsengisoli Gsoil 348]
MAPLASLFAGILLSISQGQTPAPGAIPQDPMKGLAFLLGSWESKETTKGPEGKEVAFTLKGKNTLILEGRYLQIDEAFEVAEMGKFANHILFNFDPSVRKYRGYWFMNHRAQPIVFTGVLGDKQFVITDADEKLRITYDLLEPGHYKAEVAIKRDDKWEVNTTAEYRRTGE